MKELSELFWKANVEEMKRGYVFVPEDEVYICLACGETYEQGVIYKEGEKYYDAEKSAKRHVAGAHTSMFHYLLSLNKKITGLTELQSSLLQQFYEGFSDAQIVKASGSGSASTIRAHRFSLKEKERQAKVFLAIMELLDEKPAVVPQDKFIPIHKTATAVDERYNLTEEENASILKKYFPDGVDGMITEFPKKEKRKIAILKQLITRFETRKEYTEKEVNTILQTAFADYVTLRRYMIEYGFMDRKDDCSAYWVKN